MKVNGYKKNKYYYNKCNNLSNNIYCKNNCCKNNSFNNCCNNNFNSPLNCLFEVENFLCNLRKVFKCIHLYKFFK